MKHAILNPARAGAGGRSRLGSSFHCLTLPGLILGASLFAGCAAAPLGPAFVKSEPPPPHRSRVYVYRADIRSSLSKVRASIDGRLLGDLRDGEYETTEMASGAHRLRAGLRGFGLTAWGWNEKTIRLEPGKTLYIQLSVRLEGHEQPVLARSISRDGPAASRAKTSTSRSKAKKQLFVNWSARPAHRKPSARSSPEPFKYSQNIRNSRGRPSYLLCF